MWCVVLQEIFRCKKSDTSRCGGSNIGNRVDPNTRKTVVDRFVSRRVPSNRSGVFELPPMASGDDSSRVSRSQNVLGGQRRQAIRALLQGIRVVIHERTNPKRKQPQTHCRTWIVAGDSFSGISQRSEITVRSALRQCRALQNRRPNGTAAVSRSAG